MRPYRLLFSVADRDGNEVRLDEGQWEGHVISRHPEVEPYLEEIQQAINDPEIVTLDDNGAFHYSRFGVVSSRQRQYLIVVVTYSDELNGKAARQFADGLFQRPSSSRAKYLLTKWEAQDMTDEEMTDEELIACINRANPEWLARVLKEKRRILYDYESDIFCVRFGTDHKFGYLFAPETVSQDIDIKIEEDGLRIIGVDVMYFRKDFLACHADLSAAFDALCLKHGRGDLFLDLPPYSQANEGDAAHAVADLLSKIADGLILS